MTLTETIWAFIIMLATVMLLVFLPGCTTKPEYPPNPYSELTQQEWEEVIDAWMKYSKPPEPVTRYK